MNKTPQLQNDAVPADKVRAQAAAWVAQLHDDQHSPDLEERVRAWLAEGEDHRRAFARMMHVWERAGLIRIRSGGNMAALRTGRRVRFAHWGATMAATVVLAAVILSVYFWRDNAVVTGVGQQRVQLLQDGTRVVLNTDTRIEVNYDERARRVHLIRGEAWFNVAKRPTWPFLVSVGGQEIRALGTSFIVRRDDAQGLSITLVEGQISVAPTARRDETPARDVQILAPGERLVISRNHARTVDRPELTRITAWEQGRVEFEETPLETAVKEMNRYSTTHVAVADANVARLRIGGVFHAGDSQEFVRIVTAALGLRADQSGGEILLSQSTDSPPAARVPQR
jgi:transmembrane sensor